MKLGLLLVGLLPCAAGVAMPANVTLDAPSSRPCGENVRNFALTGRFRAEHGAAPDADCHLGTSWTFWFDRAR